MPPHRPRHPGVSHTREPERTRGPMAASQVLGFVDKARLAERIAPWVLDAADRDFVVRCLVAEGPIHHRGSNYILLTLLAQLVEKLTPPPVPGVGLPVPMRLPPHLADDVPEGVYPLTLPTDALMALADGNAAQLDAMVDCLTDGPPQHALANVLMVTLLGQLLGAPRC